MKIWWVLGWDHYYPSGSLNNVISTHESEEEAKAKALDLRLGKYDNVEIINVSNLIGLEQREYR